MSTIGLAIAASADPVAKKIGIDKQILVIQDRAKFKEMIDELGDDDLAILVTRKSSEGDNQMRLASYGEGQETEFLGLLSYAQVIMHRCYFTDEVEDD